MDLVILAIPSGDGAGAASDADDSPGLEVGGVAASEADGAELETAVPNELFPFGGGAVGLVRGSVLDELAAGGLLVEPMIGQNEVDIGERGELGAAAEVIPKG
jgi:hypothetical protein